MAAASAATGAAELLVAGIGESDRADAMSEKPAAMAWPPPDSIMPCLARRRERCGRYRCREWSAPNRAPCRLQSPRQKRAWRNALSAVRRQCPPRRDASRHWPPAETAHCPGSRPGDRLFQDRPSRSPGVRLIVQIELHGEFVRPRPPHARSKDRRPATSALPGRRH